MNKLIIGDTEFELEHHLTMSSSQSHSTPYVTMGNTIYVGKAIPNTPKEKPPLGLEPRFISIQEKLNEIYSALRGYDAGKEIQKEWVDEKNELENFKIKAEKDKPKNYEILEIISHGDEVRKLIDGLYRLFEDGVGFELGYLLNRTDTSIKSVKRISDSEIFSIGDKVERMDDNDTIDAFILNYKGNDIWVSTDVKNGYGSSLECAKKAKQPILTTEDGVDMYDGDMLWYFGSDFHIMRCPADLLEPIKEGYKYFSTREAADNYVLMNRPCLSMEDIFKICDKYNVMNYLYVQGKVREMVKDKLAKNKPNVK